jgi:REP element-mobilizing transposase RayT
LKLQNLIEHAEKESPKKKIKKTNKTTSSYLEEEMEDGLEDEEEELQQGDRVASRVDGENFWILSKFVSMIDKNKYEIEDEDIDENNTKVRKRYRLHKNRIIPLSKVSQESS